MTADGTDATDDGDGGEEQDADRLPPLAGEWGLFHPDGVYRVDDLMHKVGMSNRAARAFLRDHVRCHPITKSERLFIGRAFNAAIARLTEPGADAA